MHPLQLLSPQEGGGGGGNHKEGPPGGEKERGGTNRGSLLPHPDTPHPPCPTPINYNHQAHKKGNTGTLGV